MQQKNEISRNEIEIKRRMERRKIEMKERKKSLVQKGAERENEWQSYGNQNKGKGFGEKTHKKRSR